MGRGFETPTPEHHEHQLGAGPGLKPPPPSIMNISWELAQVWKPTAGCWPGFETPAPEHQERQLGAEPIFNPSIMSITWEPAWAFDLNWKPADAREQSRNGNYWIVTETETRNRNQS